jgi:hypothetical protein
VRDARLYIKQRRAIENYLLSLYSEDDAAATAGKGYSPEKRRPLRTRDVATIAPFRSQFASREAPERADRKPHPEQRPAPRYEPRWVEHIVRSLDRQQPHLRELVPQAMQELSLLHRIILVLHQTEDLSFRDIEDWREGVLGISKSSAQRKYEEGIDYLVRWVYDDQGSINWHGPREDDEAA